MQSIKAKAFSLLAKRAYFSKELERKLLEKGYPPSEIADLLGELREKGWLNDEELAARFVERHRERGYGARAIAFKLKEKAGEINFPISESKEAALSLIKKKYFRELPEKKEKVMAALVRRGFSYDLIRSILEDVKCM